MYEGLIEFIESRCSRSPTRSPPTKPTATRQASKLVEMLLAFAEKNPGMMRVMTGDALVGEHERLQARMNQFYDRFESTLKQALRVAAGDPGAAEAADSDIAAQAGAMLRYVIGSLAPVREIRLHAQAHREFPRPAALPRRIASAACAR